jgi:serine/threonine protein kinase
LPVVARSQGLTPISECLCKDRSLEYYYPRQNDIWALGMILINMTTGCSPWRSAIRSDGCFLSYLRDPSFLRTMLPLSKSAVILLRRILVLNPLERITISQIRAELLIVDTFFMTAAELKRSDRHMLEAAENYLKLGLAAAPLAMSQSNDEEEDLYKVKLVPESPASAKERYPDHAALPHRPLPRPPVAAANSSSLPSMLAVSGSALAPPSFASSDGPITPETHAAANVKLVDAMGSVEELALPHSKVAKKERDTNLFRHAMQKPHLRR